ncbi:hypothetical protein HXX76_016129 [Chlamydomonas incerta]|uniref:Nucleotide-diphospho-sugar transferase domain-containing protein n=1 Tax=Chlamydomonas incerta TaxID=51695 RepID=A0A835S8K3_CHLIN|nr:hypothetical protein HXX76_016129 [Chlamydomonas incerta]|eukprot:KAG2422304.1 hypothetical protein HXX76_016129 [Chlamydomonas incerta]
MQKDGKAVAVDGGGGGGGGPGGAGPAGAASAAKGPSAAAAAVSQGPLVPLVQVDERLPYEAKLVAGTALFPIPVAQGQPQSTSSGAQARLALSDIALVLVSSRSEAAAKWVTGQRFWRKSGVDIIVLASNVTVGNEWPENAAKGGREAWIRAKGGDDAEVAATAAVEAAAFLRASGGTAPKWLFVTQAHSVVNLLALRDALAELDPSEPHAVTDALFCERRGGGAAAQQRRLRNSAPAPAGAAGTCAPCHHGDSTSPSECAKINPAGGVALSWGLLAACRPFADTAAAQDLLYAATALGSSTDTAYPAAHAAVAAHSGGSGGLWGGGGGANAEAPHPPTAPHSVGAGLSTLSRVLWIFGVPVMPAWGEEPRVAISAAAAAAAAASAGNGNANSNTHWVVKGGRFKRMNALAGQPKPNGSSNVTDVATLAAAVAGGSCSSAGCLNALYRTVVPTAPTAALGAGPAVAATVVTSALSAPAAGSAAGSQLTQLYEALAAAWEKAAVARKTAPASKDAGAKEGKKAARSADASAKASAASAEAPTRCPQPGPLQPGERWEDGVLLVQVDTRAPAEPKPDPFALGPNYVMPPYPPWPDFDAGIKYGPVFLGESPKVGFYPAPGQYTYTADPKQHTYYTGTATMNRLVAEGLGMSFRRVTWPVADPNERYGTWTKNDFFMKLMQYVLYEQCGLAAPAGGAKASRLQAAHLDIIRQILPPGGLRLLIFLDGDVYIRDPQLFHKQLAAFHDDPAAWLAFSEEPNQRNAYAVVSPQYVNTGLQVLRPSPELLRYYQAVWDSPYTLNRTDLLWGWPHEQGCHNLLTYQGQQLLQDHIRRWPFMDYNTPGGRVARHAWGIRDQWWPILAEDMVAVSVWNFHQRHAGAVYVPTPAWS